MILACQNINKAFGEDVILRDVSFHIEEREKIAIVGTNGSGKSTLLKIIMGELESDSGQVVIGKDVTVGYLCQQPDINLNKTIWDELLETKQHLIDAENRLREMEEQMKHLSGDELDSLMNSYHHLMTKYEAENAYALESEITGVLKGLGFVENDFSRNVSTLSGGQKMRVYLGKLLLTKPDILILDEPTNHLDMPSLAWLETYLSAYKGAVIIVSHDRYFIDKISSKIIEIDNTKATVYHGNYSFFITKRAEIKETERRAYENQQREIAHQEAVIDKLKQFNREKSIKRAESREKMLDKIERLDKPTELRTEMRLKLTPSFESGEDVLKVEKLSKAYGDNVLFKDLSFLIKRGEKVSVIGGNGTGKSTLLKILNRQESRDEGLFTLGSRVKIAYYDQEQKLLSPNKTIFDEISDAYPEMDNTRIRNTLAAFLFTGDDVFKRIDSLSGGEKGRVSLAKLMLSPANFIILDEPTNHLDIISKEILENALRIYEGTVLLVSHDRYLINKVSTRILELKDKTFYDFPGNFDYYESHKDLVYAAGGINSSAAVDTLGTSASNQASSSIASQTSPSTGGTNTSGMSDNKAEYLRRKEEAAAKRKIENDYKKTEARIEELETKIEALDEEFSRPENATNSKKLRELSEEREKLDSELAELYAKWEELAELL